MRFQSTGYFTHFRKRHFQYLDKGNCSSFVRTQSVAISLYRTWPLFATMVTILVFSTLILFVELSSYRLLKKHVQPDLDKHAEVDMPSCDTDPETELATASTSRVGSVSSVMECQTQF